MENNPLKQYFRRPSIYIRLPSGTTGYPPGVVDFPETGELAVYPMTAIDEITSKTPDALFNGHAVVDIIKSCIPAIKDPWQISSMDLDMILIAIRVASTGEEMEISSTCPSCNNEADYGVNLVELLSQQKSIDYSETLAIGDLKIKFKPLSYGERNKTSLEQYELQKALTLIETIEDPDQKQEQTNLIVQKLNTLMSGVVASTVESISTPETTVTDRNFIKEFMDNCDRKTSNAIREQSTKLTEKNKLKPLHLHCIACKHEYDQNFVLNITDFFG